MSESKTQTVSNNVNKKTNKHKSNEDTLNTDGLKEIYKDLYCQISSMKSQLTALTQKIKSSEKAANKKIKQLEKENRKSKNKGNRPIWFW